MLFGRRNAPDIFQSTMDAILAVAKYQFALVYLDNIVLFSRISAEYIDHVRKVLTLINNAGETFKLKKYCLFTDTINYLCNITRPYVLK